MRFDLITIFPEFFAGPLDHGILRRARESGLVEVHVQDLRVFTKDRHRSVDDRPFGGGEGMVLKPEPLFEAVEALLGRSVGDATQQTGRDPKTAIVLLSAAGELFTQETARRYAQLERVIFLCGRYEGVDERVAEHLATEEISIGDFVLSGGELAAALILDAVTRLLPGALGNEASSKNESFSERSPRDLGGAAAGGASPAPTRTGEGGLATNGAAETAAATETETETETKTEAETEATTESESKDEANKHLLLDYPHYTRPAEYRGWAVPEVLIGGNHAEVAKWRRAAALEKTRRKRPDLLLPR